MIPSQAASIALIVAMSLPGPSASAQEEGPRPKDERGLVKSSPAASPGYTLFAPLHSGKTYLIGLQGEVVHTWTSEYGPGSTAYLRGDGNLVRCAREPDNPVFQGGGQGGRLQEWTWDGELVWDFQYSDGRQMQHHDIEILPNGNILLIAWERKSAAEAMAAGRDPETLTARELWPDKVVEIRPKPPKDAEVVWEWHAWDHLIQDFDPERDDYGDPAEHPELIDVNFASGSRGPRSADQDQEAEERARRLRGLGYLGGRRERDRSLRGADWMHTNAIDYRPDLDQIALSVRSFHEIWIIDHSTTTEEAAGHEGGRSGKGGDLLYRYGNPQAYRAGTEEDRRFFGQHDVRWIPKGHPGAGQLMVFNNGEGRPGGDYSTVEAFAPALSSKGQYLRVTGQTAWGPEDPVWTYEAPERETFYSGHISGAQRLPNGNTLICEGEEGRFFEVTSKGDIVWEYLNPFGGDLPVEMRRGRGRRGGPARGNRGGGGGPGGRGPGNPVAVFRVERYHPSHPGLSRLSESDGD